MIAAGAGYGAPVGAYYEDLESGLNLGANLRVAVGSSSWIAFRYRNQTLYSGTEMFPIDSEVIAVDVGLAARQYLLMLGVLNTPSDGQSLGGYIEFGVGLIDHVATAEFLGEEVSSSQCSCSPSCSRST